jgi:hypothetical protein
VFATRLEAAALGELTRLVLAHGPFPAGVGGTIGPYTAENYAPWADMLKRWAVSFMSIVRRLSSRETLEILGMRRSSTRRVG